MYNKNKENHVWDLASDIQRFHIDIQNISLVFSHAFALFSQMGYALCILCILVKLILFNNTQVIFQKHLFVYLKDS